MLKKLLFEEPESGADAIYGKYLFDTQRNDIPKKEKEPETQEEKELYKSFFIYIGGNNKYRLSADAPGLLKLIQKGKYLPILDPGNREVYRLLVIFGDANANQFISGVSKIKENEAVTFGPGTHFPFQSNITGWTTNKNLLYSINGDDSWDENQYFILLFAHISDNPNKFFGNPDRLSTLFSTNEENETIGFGKINYKKAVVVKKLAMAEVDNLPEAEQKPHLVPGDTILQNHNQTLKEEPESGSNAIFGKYAFDTDREDIPEEEKEKNTEIENQIKMALDDYISGNKKKSLSSVAPSLLHLIKKGLYKPILEPDNIPVYRLLQFIYNLNDLKIIYPNYTSLKDNILKIISQGIIKPFEGNISGWSSQDFFFSDSTPLSSSPIKPQYYLGLKANPSDNPDKFFGKQGALAASVTGSDSYDKEFETIGYGPIQYEKAAIIKVTNRDSSNPSLTDIFNILAA